jgi:hypothetical protein
MIGITGNVHIIWTDHNGATWSQEFHNLVVDSGLNLIRDRLAGATSNYVTHFAVGTGTTAVTGAQTALATEVFRDGVTTAITSTSKAVRFEYYLPASYANGNTLTEIGLFTAPSGGTMVARALLTTPIVKSALVTATFQWTISLSAT